MPGVEEAQLKAEIKAKLSSLMYSNSQPVFEAVLTREEAFSGPFVSNAADLIVPINHATAPPLPERWDFISTHPTLKGTHTPLGILIAKGEGIKKNYTVKKANIIDITPTILYIFDEPLTEDMDGKVLTDIFDNEFNANRKITWKGSSKKVGFSNNVSFEEEDEVIKQRLRDLGYID
jgi:predicted AlkP superfamily phosphohydrolase/phosphomutase